MIEESQLIKRLKTGDLKAMKQLMSIHQNYVYTLALQMVKSSVAAEELTQDVFIKVFKKINDFQERAKFTTWLYTITYRTCLNYLEKKQIVFSESSLQNETDQEFLNDDINLKDINRNEFEKAFDTERQKIVWQAIDSLPVQQGIIIALHYLQQFTVQEIAGLMQVPENTVKTHLFRGRKGLRTELLKNYSQEELL